MLKSVTLLGSSSGRNAGDAALMAAIMDGVDRCCETNLLYEIPTIRPAYLRENYSNRVKPIGMLPWNLSAKMLGLPTLRSIMRTDLTLVFDAILFDRSLYNPLFNFMSTLYLFLPYAARHGKRVAGYNIGAGPVSAPAGRRMLRALADLMTFVTVRDRESLDILRDVGVRNPRILLTADAALNAPSADAARGKAILRATGLDPAQPILGININVYLDTWASPARKSIGKSRFLEVYSAALSRVAGEIRAPLLFVATQHADVEITRELMSRMPPGCAAGLLSNRDYNHLDMKAALSRIGLLCGMRLHAMILASSALTPIVGLAYQPKVAYYYNTVGLPEYVLGFDAFDAERLAGHILKGWRERDAIRQRLEAAVPRLQDEAGKAAELVAALHRGEDLDAAMARK